MTLEQRQYESGWGVCRICRFRRPVSQLGIADERCIDGAQRCANMLGARLLQSAERLGFASEPSPRKRSTRRRKVSRRR